MLKKPPPSAWIIVVAAMAIAAFWPDEDQHDRVVEIWLWTAIPVFWAWTFFVWWVQGRKGADRR